MTWVQAEQGAFQVADYASPGMPDPVSEDEACPFGSRSTTIPLVTPCVRAWGPAESECKKV